MTQKKSESEACAVMKRECPKVEGKRKRKGIPGASQQGKSLIWVASHSVTD